ATTSELRTAVPSHDDSECGTSERRRTILASGDFGGDCGDLKVFIFRLSYLLKLLKGHFWKDF
ncbi:hypothetical protein Csa_023926, partial [Cucumis sativus]